MIFITTGSRSFQFNRLLKAVDEAIELGFIKDKVFAQIGDSDYKIKNYNFSAFLNHDEFNEKIGEAEIVLTHGGTGVIVNSVKAGKKVIAVPRLKEFGEVVDDHQIELVKAFDNLGIITPCFDCTPQSISKAISIAKQKEVKPYISNTKNVLDSIEDFIDPTRNKIRVLMCSSARTEKGGMNSVIDQLMDHDWGDEFEFTYLATHISGNPVKKSLFFARSYLRLKKLIKKNTFDIIHIHMSYKGSFFRKYYVTKLCKKNSKKVIIHLHGSEFKDFYYSGDENRKAKIQELFNLADVTIVLGESWREFITSISPKANVVIVNNAVKIPDIDEKKPHERVTFLFLVALIKRKGVMDLLQATKQLVNEGVTSFKVLIAGSGAEEQSLKSYVTENSLSNFVDFLGWVENDDKPGLFEKSDVLVLPSYNEGLPIAILEAMSYGLPIISTNVGSISEAVENDKNGYLFFPGNVDDMHDGMKQLVLSKDKWNVYSKNSRKYAINKFSEDVYFNKMEIIYRELIKRNHE